MCVVAFFLCGEKNVEIELVSRQAHATISNNCFSEEIAVEIKVLLVSLEERADRRTVLPEERGVVGYVFTKESSKTKGRFQ